MIADQRRRPFAAAFIAQARSDWAVYRLLAAQPGLPRCHMLHYLQMVCEKLAKAYRLRDTQVSAEELLSRHVGFTKFVGSFCGVALKDEYQGRDAQFRGLLTRSRAIAREIEKLAPAIDRGASPENAEYPWARNGEVIAPCSWDFPNLELLRGSGGRAFLNLIERALDDFERLSDGS